MNARIGTDAQGAAGATPQVGRETTYRLVQLTGGAREINARNQVAMAEFLDLGRVEARFFDGNGIVALGTLGGPVSIGVAANERGQVAGTSTVDESGLLRAFLWSRATGMIDLGTGGGAEQSQANDINNRGQVIGGLNFADGSLHPFIWSRQTGMVDLGLIEGESAGATEINDAGRIMGLLPNAGAGFTWTAEDGIEVIRVPGASGTGTRDLNAYGQIAGNFVGPGGGGFYLWTPGEGVFQADDPDVTVNALNDREMIVGERGGHAFLWSRGEGMADLGVLPGYATSVATDVNNLAQVTGWSQSSVGNPRAFLWSPDTGMVDLNTIVTNLPAGLRLAFGQAINDNGAILVFADPGGQYLLLPGRGRNEAPVVTPIVVSGMLDINVPLSFGANFTDVDLEDTHTALWSWGDGTTQLGAVAENNGAGSVSATHTYTATGLYTVTLTLSDSGGRSTVVRRNIGVGVPAPVVAGGTA